MVLNFSETELIQLQTSYLRRGKIRWAKQLWFQPYEIRSFSRKYFRTALATSVYYLPTAKNSWENFCGTHKNYESLDQRIFPRLRYMQALLQH